MAALYNQQLNPWSDDDVRGFLQNTFGVRLPKTQPINDDLLKGLGRSYPAARKPHVSVAVTRASFPRRSPCRSIQVGS